MFRSKTDGDEVVEPEHIRTGEFEDSGTGNIWVSIMWSGPTYEDAWIEINKDDLSELEQKR